MKAKHAITLEWLRMGALKGIIYDSDASTVLYNLYTEFGITAKTVAFALGTATTKVLAKCLEVKRHIDDNLKGDVMTGVVCLCASGFYDSLVSLPWSKKPSTTGRQLPIVWAVTCARASRSAASNSSSIAAQSTDAAGTARPFITANEAWAFPVGTQATFQTLYSTCRLYRNGQHDRPAAVRQAGSPAV